MLYAIYFLLGTLFGVVVMGVLHVAGEEARQEERRGRC